MHLLFFWESKIYIYFKIFKSPSIFKTQSCICYVTRLNTSFFKSGIYTWEPKFIQITLRIFVFIEGIQYVHILNFIYVTKVSLWSLYAYLFKKPLENHWSVLFKCLLPCVSSRNLFQYMLTYVIAYIDNNRSKRYWTKPFS